MSQIERVHGRQILDSRGNPTVEVDVLLKSGAAGRAAVRDSLDAGADPELALRQAAHRFRTQVEAE